MKHNLDDLVESLANSLGGNKATGKSTESSLLTLMIVSLVGYLIDEIYSKERKYVKNYDKDNFLNSKSPIFELQKYANLKTLTGVEKNDD